MYRKPFVVISLCCKPRIGLEWLMSRQSTGEQHNYVDKRLYSCSYGTVSEEADFRAK